jgi:hypothetical protein
MFKRVPTFSATALIAVAFAAPMGTSPGIDMESALHPQTILALDFWVHR